MRQAIFSEGLGRWAFGVAAGGVAVIWWFVIYGTNARLWHALLYGAVVGWLSVVSKAPISTRLLGLAAVLLLLLGFNLLGRAVTPH